MGYIKKRKKTYDWRCYSIFLRLLLQTTMRPHRKSGQMKITLIGFFVVVVVDVVVQYQRKCGQTNCVKNCYCIGCCLCCCCYGCCSCFYSISMNMVVIRIVSIIVIGIQDLIFSLLLDAPTSFKLEIVFNKKIKINLLQVEQPLLMHAMLEKYTMV